MHKTPKKQQKKFILIFAQAVKKIPGYFESKEKKEFKRWKDFIAN